VVEYPVKKGSRPFMLCSFPARYSGVEESMFTAAGERTKRAGHQPRSRGEVGSGGACSLFSRSGEMMPNDGFVKRKQKGLLRGYFRTKS
jgi:hypothetical protein